MQLTQYKSIFQKIIDSGLESRQSIQDIHDLLCGLRDEGGMTDRYMHGYALKVSNYAKQMAEYNAKVTGSGAFDDLYWRLLLFEAPYLFESYMYYMEKKRPDNKKFYYPRRRTLKTLVDDLQDLEDRKIEYLGISLPPRVGKAVAYDTPVLTNHGWKKHGELNILDKVIGLDGEFKSIYAIHNPCEMEYEVEFADGEKVICHGNHEWTLYDRHSRKNIDVETKYLYANGWEEADGRHRYFVPDKEMLIGCEEDLCVDPYTLGAWLGDGRNTNPDICGAESDYAIVQKILDNGYELAWDTKHKTTGVRYYGFRKLREQLQKYDMCHSRRRSPKHIPSEYLTATIDKRLELLAGLLDTDGTLTKKEHRYQFTTNEEILRDDFISLVNTFGWRTSVVRYEYGMSSSGIYANKPYWVISFNPTIYIPCQLERKQLFDFSKQRRVSIKAIRKIEQNTVFGNCITVEDGIYCVGKTLKPTHNSTLCIFFLSWIMGKRPNSHNAMSGHSGILADGFYNEILNLIGTPEYTWSEIFRGVKIQKKSADKKEITLDRPDRFATLTCRGIDGTFTGAVDISSDGYLYVDDLVRDRMESLSPERLENRYQDYLNVLVDRKNDGSRELCVGTRWNTLDYLTRTENEYKYNTKYRFRKIPALNENDESNFVYDFGLGFTTDYYIKMRERLDRPEWMAKFQQAPYVREGLLFPEEELKMFDGVIPDGDYKIIAACDPAFGGGDSVSMPICLVHENGKKYIIDWIHDKRTVKYTVPRICDYVEKYNITEIRFEKNNGGNLFLEDVKEEFTSRGYFHCRCYEKSAPVKIHKEDKIKAYADWIKDNFIFLMPNRGIINNDAFKRSEDYQKALMEVEMFTAEGKNVNDDSPDALTQLAMIFENKFATPPTKIVRSPI